MVPASGKRQHHPLQGPACPWFRGQLCARSAMPCPGQGPQAVRQAPFATAFPLRRGERTPRPRLGKPIGRLSAAGGDPQTIFRQTRRGKETSEDERWPAVIMRMHTKARYEIHGIRPRIDRIIPPFPAAMNLACADDYFPGAKPKTCAGLVCQACGALGGTCVCLLSGFDGGFFGDFRILVKRAA